jgi:hypothetical protein
MVTSNDSLSDGSSARELIFLVGIHRQERVGSCEPNDATTDAIYASLSVTYV